MKASKIAESLPLPPAVAHGAVEFFPIPQKGLDPYFGLSRWYYYALERAGLLRMVRIRRPGTVQGKVLIPYADVSALLRKLASESANTEPKASASGGHEPLAVAS